MVIHRKIWLLTSILFSLLLMVSAVTVFLFVFPVMMRSKIQEIFVLQNGTELWDLWVKPPVPVYTRFYIFNVTNPDETMNGDVPKLEQVGPFVFRQEIERHVDSNGDETLSVRTVKTYHFEPSLSLELDTPVNVINVPLISLVKKMLDQALNVDDAVGIFLFWNGLGKAFSEARLVSSMTAGELLFDGHFEPLLKAFTENTGISTLPDYTFSLFGDKNGTDDGILEIFTGKGDSKNYTMIYQWNEESELTFWEGDYCNKIEGTDGRQFPPLVTKEDRLKVFVPDLCRSLHLKHEEDEVIKGIEALKFVIPSDVLAAPSVNPENECFVQREEETNISGILDISVCRQGMPVVMSLPHFYMGSEELLQAVSGLKPEKEKHESSVFVEPMTGTVIKAALRFQVNVRLLHSGAIKPLKNAEDGTIFPVVWIDEGATIDDENASLLESKVQEPIDLAIKLLLAVIGVALIVAVLGIGCDFCTKSDQSSKKKSEYVEI